MLSHFRFFLGTFTTTFTTKGITSLFHIEIHLDWVGNVNIVESNSRLNHKSVHIWKKNSTFFWFQIVDFVRKDTPKISYQLVWEPNFCDMKCWPPALKLLFMLLPLEAWHPQLFKASADASYKSKCPSVCLSVRLFVHVSVHFWGTV